MPRSFGFVATKKMLLAKVPKPVVPSILPKVEPEPIMSVEIPTIDDARQIESPLSDYDHELQPSRKIKKKKNKDLERKVNLNPLEESKNELAIINSR